MVWAGTQAPGIAFPRRARHRRLRTRRRAAAQSRFDIGPPLFLPRFETQRGGGGPRVYPAVERLVAVAALFPAGRRPPGYGARDQLLGA